MGTLPPRRKQTTKDRQPRVNVRRSLVSGGGGRFCEGRSGERLQRGRGSKQKKLLQRAPRKQDERRGNTTPAVALRLLIRAWTAERRAAIGGVPSPSRPGGRGWGAAQTTAAMEEPTLRCSRCPCPGGKRVANGWQTGINLVLGLALFKWKRTTP